MRTLRRGCRIRGRALFSGGPVTARLSPGRRGWRWRLGPGPFHRLSPEHLQPLPHRSRLVCGGDVVTLPEHLLAALVLLDLDAVDLELDREVPIGDGSAAPFLGALRAAGVTGASRSTFCVSTAQASTDRDPGRARTFIHRADARRLRPLYRGGRPGDAVILDGGAALYGGRPRMPNEPALHKLLDLLGDLGPWRALGPLTGTLHVDAPRHIDNPGAIAAAVERGDLVVGCGP